LKPKIILIYVQLLDEGIEVYRPVKAIKIDKNIFKIMEQNTHDDESWEFNEGDIVNCKLRNGVLIALKLQNLK
jgi:hypothetical protein